MKKTLQAICGVAALMAAAGLFGMRQSPQNGPSFPCNKAQTSTEKAICSDEELAALDLEYSQLYEKQIKEGTPTAVSVLKSDAKSFLQSRDRCANDRDCIADWYYWRTAELSELPTPPPAEWTPRLVAAVNTYVDRNRGLPSTQKQKPVPTLYFKPRQSNAVFKWPENYEAGIPASIDPAAGTYSVYLRVLGSLTYVVNRRDDGHLDESYFFNKDGRLAAQKRRADKRDGDKTYVEYETIYYGREEQETRRRQEAFYDGKKSAVRKELSPPPIEKPAFGSFAVLSDAMFKDAGTVDAEQLGICIIDLGDGYGKALRIVNFPAQPLDVYQRFPPPMNHRNFDSYAVPGKPRGNAELLGTLGGKRVYAVRYSNGLTGVLVERQADRYLPVLYVNPELQIDHLQVMKLGSEDLLAYSTTVPGNGHLTVDYYFTLDRGIPKSIHYQTVLSKELERILPRGYGILKGGGFNIDTLVFSNSVWEEGNAGCCPSGGSVNVVLGLEKAEFVVRSSHYEKPR